MRLLIEVGPVRLDLTIGVNDEEEEEELPFGFVSGSSLETEIVEE